MKRSKKLLILLAVLVVCVGVYLAASHFLGGGESEDGSIALSEIDEETLREIKWVYNGEEVALISDDGKEWKYKDDGDFPLDSEKAASMASCVCSISAVKKVADAVEDKAKYGLDEPEIKLTVTAGDETNEYLIGDCNEATGYYYFTRSGDEALYYVDTSLHSTFAVRLLDIVKFEYITEISTTDVTSFAVKCGDKTLNVEYLPEGKDGFGDSYTYFISGASLPCDTDTAQSMISGFVNIGWLTCEAYNVDSASLAEYGLDAPLAEFTVNYTYEAESESASGETETVSGSDTLLIGKNKDEDCRYTMIKGGKCVYTVDEETAKMYMITSEESLYSKELLSFSAEEITALSVEYRGNKYEITAEASGETDEYGEGVEISYKIGGDAIELDTFISLLSSLKAESVQKDEISNSGDKLLSVTVTDADGAVQTLEIYEYDENLCALSLNGQKRYFAEESECDDICDAFRDAIK